MIINPVTIKDIAKLLGLSKSTVSRALKNHPDISADTKDAVMILAEKLHYRPNTVAVTLRHKRSKIIGLIVPQLSYFFFPSVILGIEAEATRHGYKLMILHSNEQYEREVEACNILLSGNVEGVLVSVSRKTTDFNHFNDILKSGLPLVFFDRVPEDVKADKVLVDDLDGSYRGVRHLIEIGCKRIAICLGNANLLISKNRLKGYKAAFQEVGRPVDETYIIAGESTEEVEAKMMDLLNLPNPPDGIFAISDLTMSGIMKAIYRKKLQVPTDIAVMGFCEEPFSSMYSPPVSTIKPMGFEIGQKAAELLFEKIFNEGLRQPPKRIDIVSELVVRESTRF